MYLCKRALYLRKRALQDARVTKETCVKSFNRLCISAKEPYISTKEPYISANEPCTSAYELYISAKEPYISAKELRISAKEPYISAKEPYETHESQKRPAPSHEQKRRPQHINKVTPYNKVTPCHTREDHTISTKSHHVISVTRPLDESRKRVT